VRQGRPGAARADRVHLSEPRALPDRAHARSADATSAEAGVPLLDEDYLILSTIHSAKGQEWDTVFCRLNVVDGCIPSDLGTGSTAEIEEEAAAALCRDDAAKDHLHLVVPQRFSSPISSAATATGHMYAARRGSFRLRCSTDSPAAPGPSPPPRRPGVGRSASPSISARGLRGMWRSA